jgi:hypothetical protein
MNDAGRFRLLFCAYQAPRSLCSQGVFWCSGSNDCASVEDGKVARF